MVQHWLEAEPNGYLGSSYGSDLKSYLFLPMSADIADSIIAKMIEDIPILSALPAGAINLYIDDSNIETKTLYIDINGMQIPFTLPRTTA